MREHGRTWDLRHPSPGLDLGFHLEDCLVLVALNKCLAQSNKFRTGRKATKKRPGGSRRIDETGSERRTMNVTMEIATALVISASIVGTANARGKIYCLSRGRSGRTELVSEI